MKKVLSIITASLFIVTSLIGCKKEVKIQNVTEVEPYLYEVEPYTELDYVAAEKFYAKNYDKWGGGCSCVAKNLDDGRTVLGRNMDLTISNKCAYVVRTECKNKYKTFGLAYTFRDYSPDYDIVKENGLSEEFSKILPFICDDIMNEQGLYIEVNMRNAEVWPGGQDKFACSGTNPFSKERVYMFGLSRYIAENCATCEEAVKYAKTLNVYSEEKYWNYCFMIGDAYGNYGLLEFCNNEVYWLPKQSAQANFYVNEYGYALQDTKTGIGRYENLINGIDAVKTKEDLFNLINTVTYFQTYDPYNCKYDPRSENLGSLPGFTYDLLLNAELKDITMKIFEECVKPIRNMDRQALRDACMYWESAFTEVADCYEGTIMVRFFENDDMKYKLSFDGFEKIDKIA